VLPHSAPAQPNISNVMSYKLLRELNTSSNPCSLPWKPPKTKSKVCCNNKNKKNLSNNREIPIQRALSSSACIQSMQNSKHVPPIHDMLKVSFEEKRIPTKLLKSSSFPPKSSSHQSIQHSYKSTLPSQRHPILSAVKSSMEVTCLPCRTITKRDRKKEQSPLFV